MAKKTPPKKDNPNVMGLQAKIVEQPITDTLEENYMPYAMSVIVSRAIPEIDGFKPSHRKLLYTMYQMKLLGGSRTKSANVVGATMKLNPHGDAAIYETLVRLARGNGALLHPFIDSKGNFGKVYSRDMAYAASRYTEVRLDGICGEIFREIDQDTVDFVDNYDGKMQEPTLLPTAYPNVLVSANQGIAVGMASNLCGFNLGEVCDTTIACLKNANHDPLTTLLAPDLPTGGELLYHEEELRQIYETGRGSFKVRSKWRHLAKENVIEIFEIPYSTTVEAIIDKVVELVKAGKIKEISDIRDETDLSGLKIAIDLKRGTDVDKLMARLFKSTPLMDSQSCNFNILVGGMPKVLGVKGILSAWSEWRSESVRRRTSFIMSKKQEKLHLLQGLAKILVDMDKAIKLIRETEEDGQVVPNLMIGFGIDQVQANYVADIRLRNINQDYILKRTQEMGELESEIADLTDILAKPERIVKIIIKELQEIKKKYGAERRTEIIYEHNIDEILTMEEEVPSYVVHCVLTEQGYFKKITSQSYRMASEQKLKEGDSVAQLWEANNTDELLLFTNLQQCYKTRLSQLDDTKASALGDYLPTKLGMDSEEVVVWGCITSEYRGHIFFFFENGKVARVELAAYQTQTRRKKLTGAYSDKSGLVCAKLLVEEEEFALFSTDNRCLVFHTGALSPKSTRTTQGVSVLNVKMRQQLARVLRMSEGEIPNIARYRAKNLPLAGLPFKEEHEQLSLLD
ncbi:MAG: DNA topoisomerase (ATP-hydrolyzing) subunit A [Eubacteriales bacterium]